MNIAQFYSLLMISNNKILTRNKAKCSERATNELKIFLITREIVAI